MKLEILEEVPRVKGHVFRQKTLPTQMVRDGSEPLLPEHYTIFRVSYRTDIYRGPDGEQFTYDDLVAHHDAQGVKFPGTYHFSEAVDIEYWHDWGSDGNVEWEYQSTYRMFLVAETEEEEQRGKWLHESSGVTIMHLLTDYVYEIEREKRLA